MSKEGAKAQQQFLARLDIKANGLVGENEPLLAIEDALRKFAATEILVATHPLDKRGWLEHGIVAKIRARSELPLTHVMPALPREADAVSN